MHHISKTPLVIFRDLSFPGKIQNPLGKSEQDERLEKSFEQTENPLVGGSILSLGTNNFAELSFNRQLLFI